MLKTVSFGSAGQQLSAVGLGGEGVLRTVGREAEARAVIREAVAQGITYFDSARAYADSELYYGSLWRHAPDLRKTVFQTSKSAVRHRDGAWADLHLTLERLGTDYLDLWQIHDVRTEDDLAAIARPGGALEAFVRARSEGLVRFIGVTGHENPAVLARAVTEWPVDAVLLPVNPVEGVLGGFLTQVLEAARQKGIAIIGMKVLGASHYILPGLEITPELLVRYALAWGITLPIVGCSSPAEVRTLAAAAGQPPLSAGERQSLEDRIRPFASRLAFYRNIV
jgi:aryl-alcohol dehydrogenase-like predicted oxidoreductase